MKEHLGTPNAKWKLYDHRLFGLRCCAECSHPDHCPLSASNGIDVGRYIDKEWQRIISTQCPRSTVLDIWSMTQALATVGYPPSTNHFFVFPRLAGLTHAAAYLCWSKACYMSTLCCRLYYIPGKCKRTTFVHGSGSFLNACRFFPGTLQNRPMMECTMSRL